MCHPTAEPVSNKHIVAVFCLDILLGLCMIAVRMKVNEFQNSYIKKYFFLNLKTRLISWLCSLKYYLETILIL